MNQNTLFDMTPDLQRRATSAPSPPMSRSTDPETSHKAAAKVDRKTDTQIFIESCKFFGPRGGTAEEIGHNAVPEELLRIDTEEFVKRRTKYAERIRKRACDARGTGLVVLRGERDGCRVHVHVDFVKE